MDEDSMNAYPNQQSYQYGHDYQQKQMQFGKGGGMSNSHEHLNNSRNIRMQMSSQGHVTDNFGNKPMTSSYDNLDQNQAIRDFNDDKYDQVENNMQYYRNSFQNPNSFQNTNQYYPRNRSKGKNKNQHHSNQKQQNSYVNPSSGSGSRPRHQNQEKNQGSLNNSFHQSHAQQHPGGAGRAVRDQGEGPNKNLNQSFKQQNSRYPYDNQRVQHEQNYNQNFQSPYPGDESPYMLGPGQSNQRNQIPQRHSTGQKRRDFNQGPDEQQQQMQHQHMYQSPNKKVIYQGTQMSSQKKQQNNFLIIPPTPTPPLNNSERKMEHNEYQYGQKNDDEEFDVQVRKFNSTEYDIKMGMSNLKMGEKADNNINAAARAADQQPNDIYAVRKSNSVMHNTSNNKVDDMQHHDFQQSHPHQNYRQQPNTEADNLSGQMNNQRDGPSSFNSRSTGDIHQPQNQKQLHRQGHGIEHPIDQRRHTNPPPMTKGHYGHNMPHASKQQMSQTLKYDRSSNVSMNQGSGPYDEGYRTFQGRSSVGPAGAPMVMFYPPQQQHQKQYQQRQMQQNFNDNRNWHQQQQQHQMNMQQSNMNRRNDRNSLPTQDMQRSHQNMLWAANNSQGNYQPGRTSQACLTGIDAINSANYFFDTFSTGLDTLYREPQDGMISLRKNAPEEVGQIQKEYPNNNCYKVSVPEIELITQIDLSTLWDEKQQFVNKIAMDLYRLNHPNLLNLTRPIRYLDSHMPSGFLEICSECPDHISSWKSFCKRQFTLYQIVSIFRQLTEGINHMHEQGQIFRDVHPTRIHMSNGLIKLNLVGMPYNFKKLLKNQSFSGHLNYSAPEILENGPDNFLNQKVDVWSLGCCLYYLVTKRDPFDGKDPVQIKQNIRQGRLDRYHQHLGKDNIGNDRHPIVNQLLSTCLDPNQQRRPTSRQLIDYIDQLILQNIDLFKKLEQEEVNRAQSQSSQLNNSHVMNQSRVMNKYNPEFFIKHSNNEPIIVQLLPIDRILEKSVQDSDTETLSRTVNQSTNNTQTSASPVTRLQNTFTEESSQDQGSQAHYYNQQDKNDYNFVQQDLGELHSNEQINLNREQIGRMKEDVQKHELYYDQRGAKPSNNIKIPDFANIDNRCQNDRTESSESRTQQFENSWRLNQQNMQNDAIEEMQHAQMDPETDQVAQQEKMREVDDGSNADPSSTPKFNVSKQDEQRGCDVQFPFPFQDCNISQQKKNRNFQDELDSILLNQNESMSPTLPNQGPNDKSLGSNKVDRSSGSNKNEKKRDCNDAKISSGKTEISKNTHSNQDNSSYNSSAYRISIFKDTKQLYKKGWNKDKNKLDSEKNKSETDGQNKLYMFQNDEISPNPASQDSPNTKKRSGSSEDTKDHPEVQVISIDDKQRNSGRLNPGSDQRINNIDQFINKIGYLAVTTEQNEEDDQDFVRKQSAPTHMKEESHQDEFELNRMKSAPTNMKEEEEFNITRMQSQNTESKAPNEPDELSLVKSAPVDIQEDADDNFDYERMQSAPPDIFKNTQTSPSGNKDVRKISKQPSQKIARNKKQGDDLKYNSRSPGKVEEESRNEIDQHAETIMTQDQLQGADAGGFQKQQQVIKLPIPQESDNNFMHSSSMGSGNTINQEMIDLVDNLIDSSPKTRGELYDKGQFNLKIMRTREQDFKSTMQGQSNQSVGRGSEGTPNLPTELISDSKSSQSNPVLSIGFLKYESGDVYEGQFLNGRRAGKGKMIFASGDKYSGLWHHDQMSDPNGFYQFKNGDEYVGSHKPCSQLLARKYGQFDGPGKLRLLGKGEFVGNFKNHLIHGSGKFSSLDGQITIEKNWNNMAIEEFTELIGKLVDK